MVIRTRRTRVAKAGDPVDRGDVGVLFVDLLFALVVVELLEPLRNPNLVLAEGGVQLGLAFTMTLLSWIGYHLSVSRLDGPVRIDSPALAHLLLDVLMVATYWLTAISYERIDPDTGLPTEHSWWIFPNPSAVPEAIFVAAAFVFYVAWDQVAGMIHGRWAKQINAELLQSRLAKAAGEPFRRQRYRNPQEVWDDEERAKWVSRSWPTAWCLGAAIVALTVAIAAQQVGPGRASPRTWVIGIDVSLIAILVGFRCFKEWRAYDRPFDEGATYACAAVFGIGLVVPAIDALT